MDEFVLAGKGILLAAREKRFWYGFVPSFLFFGLLMNLLAGGTAKFELMAAVGMPAMPFATSLMVPSPPQT